MCGLLPGEEPDHAILKDEDRTNSRIEASEVVAHLAETELWSIDIFA